METKFAEVRVQGEIPPNSCKHSGNGHYYFNLSDDQALLKCVWFQGSRKIAASMEHDPLTGEVLGPHQRVSLADLQKGGSFVCQGKISLYPPRGEYQLVVNFMLKAGVANLAEEFERLKLKLAEAGFFDSARKRAIPKNPKRVALITSQGGAAICDFLRLAKTRGLSSKIRLFPTLVQGNEAAAEIINAIELANRQQWAEVIVLIRGGGSLEDLWCFNDVHLATSIFNSQVPVLAGIGHEIDFTLADLTADVRAATPTEAAVLLWSVRADLLDQVLAWQEKLERLQNNKLKHLDQKLMHLIKVLHLASPARRLQMLQERLEHLGLSFNLKFKNFLEQKVNQLRHYEVRLKQKLAPESLAAKELQINLLQERLERGLERLLQAKIEASKTAKQALEQRWSQNLKAKENLLEKLTALLATNNPTVLLNRGYAIIENATGQIITSTKQAHLKEDLQIHLVDGKLKVTVEKIVSNN